MRGGAGTTITGLVGKVDRWLNFFINEKKWQELPPPTRRPYPFAADRAHQQMLARYDDRNPAAFEALLLLARSFGPLPTDILQAALRPHRSSWTKSVAKNETFKKIYDTSSLSGRPDTCGGRSQS